MKVALLKRNAMGSILFKAFQELANADGKPLPKSDPVSVQHRPDESYWVITGSDKVIVAFCMVFVDDDERVIAEQILKGFIDGKAAGSAPVIRYSSDPPAELKDPQEGPWLTATFFAKHVTGDVKPQNAVTQAQSMRPFVAFHVKAAKTYMTSKMRTRIEHFKKVLDRAVPPKLQNTAAAGLMAVGVAGKLLKGVKKGA